MAQVGGAAGYVLTDREFMLKGWSAYSWVSAYFLVISVEMAYGKHIVGPHLKFASMWGPTMCAPGPYEILSAVTPLLSMENQHTATSVLSSEGCAPDLPGTPT